MFALCTCYRANWVKIYGYQYYPCDIVLYGRHSDDLLIFAKVDSMLIIVECLCCSWKYFIPLDLTITLFHILLQTYIYTSSVISISKLYSKQHLSTHESIGDANEYIILSYHHFP